MFVGAQKTVQKLTKTGEHRNYHTITKDEAIELNGKGGPHMSDEQLLVRKLEGHGMIGYLDQQERLIEDGIKLGESNLEIKYGPAIEAVSDILATGNFKAEDLKPWPVFRDLLIKRRCADFDQSTFKRN